MARRKQRFKSSWQQDLADTRILLAPAEMIGFVHFRGMDPAALGILMRLLPYIMNGRFARDFRVLGAFAHVHPRTMKKAWPDLLPYLRREGDLYTLDAPWLKVQKISADRQPLRHLLNTLIAFWGSACVYCGDEAETLEIEHIVPVTRGGTDDLTNLTLACRPCNLKKRTKTAAEFGFPHIHDHAKRIQ